MTKRDDQARHRQPGRHRALPGRVLQPGQVDEGRQVAARPAPARACPTSSSWSSWARTNKQLDANDQHIVHIVDWLWSTPSTSARATSTSSRGASTGLVRFRIDGVLHQVYQIPPAVLTAMTSRIKILARMDVVEKRRPQDGRIKTRTADGAEIELRLSTLPTAFGEKLVMRIFDPEVLVRDFKDLGFSDEDEQALGRDDQAAQRHRAGHRPDRLGQDHHAVFDAEDARHAGSERLHDRGPDRDGRAARSTRCRCSTADRPRLRRRACAR